jgi:hypothetical protein
MGVGVVSAEQEQYELGFVRGQESVRDQKHRDEQRTNRIIAVCVALCVLAVVGALTWGLNRSSERDQEVRVACVERGGVWVSTGCVWSDGAS